MSLLSMVQPRQIFLQSLAQEKGSPQLRRRRRFMFHVTPSNVAECYKQQF